MSQISIEITGEEAKALRAYRAVCQGQKQMEDGQAAIVSKSRELVKEQESLEKAAKKFFDSTRTPQEQHNKKVQELVALFQKGKIDLETYGRAMEASRAQMAKLDGTTDELAQSVRKAAREEEIFAQKAKQVYEMTRTPLEQYNAKMKELNQLLAKGKISQDDYARASRMAGDELQRAGNKGQQAFGAQAAQSLIHFAGELIGITTAATGVIKVLEEMRKVKEEAAQEARQSEMGMGSLAQLTTDPKRYKQLVAGAKEMFAQGGASSLDDAAKTVFALESAGLFEQRDIFTQLKSQGVVSDTANLARATKTIMASMGEEETGTARQVISKAFAAGQYAPSYAQDLLPAAARAGTKAKAAGVSDEELLAATAMAAEASGSAELGGTRIASMLKAMGRLGAYAEGKEPTVYTEEEFQRDKEGLAKEKDLKLDEIRHTARRDPEYLRRLQEIETEKAQLSKSHRRGESPEAVAKRAVRMKQLGDLEQQAAEEAQRRTESSPEYQNIATQFKLKEGGLIDRRKLATSGISTDDEGQILDEETQKLRKAAGIAMGKAGPDLVSRLKAIKALNLNEAQMQKVFGRAEGLDAMRVILQNENRFRQAEGEIRQAGKEDYVTKSLALPDLIPEQAAARQARKQEAAYKVASEDLGTFKNISDAAQSHIESRMAKGELGATSSPSLNIAMNRTIRWIEGFFGESYNREILREDLANKNITDPELIKQSERVLSPSLSLEKNQSTPTVDLRGQNTSTPADTFKALENAAKNLNIAAENLNQSRQNRTALAPVNQRD
jgi:hypothetical protein